MAGVTLIGKTTIIKVYSTQNVRDRHVGLAITTVRI